MFTREDVLEIVDSCFDSYASSYRTEAKEMANKIMHKRMKTKPAKIKWECYFCGEEHAEEKDECTVCAYVR